MAREWNLRFQCNHEGCKETANYRYSFKKDMMNSFELKNFANGKWACTRHTRPKEVLSKDNPTTSAEVLVEEKYDRNFFGNVGFISGLGFRAFADDFPVGTKLIVTTEIVLPK